MTELIASRTRNDLLDSLPKHSVCAELGVFRGDFSEEILIRCQPKELFLVDLWEGQIASGDRNGEQIEWIYMPSAMHSVIRRFCANREVKVIKSDSAQFLMSLPPGHLDFVYIDASHEMIHTKKEILAATFAVKKGGFITGHDYSPMFPGVVRAVDDFCQERGIKPDIWDTDKLPSFKIQI